MHKRKIDSKQIESRCPCFIQIKTYPYTSTILGKYNHNHFYLTGKNISEKLSFASKSNIAVTKH